MPKPNVIVEMRGGLVVGVVCDRAANVYVVDHDTEGADEDELRDFPVAKGQTEKVVLVDFNPVDRSEGFVRDVLKALGIKARG